MQLERPQSAPSQIRIGNTYLVNTLPATPTMKKSQRDQHNELNVESLENDGIEEIR